MKCQFCGFVNDPQAKFCGHCGKGQITNKPKKQLLLPLILGLLIVIFLVILFFFVIPQVKKQLPFFKTKTNRVVMIYMVGSDLESKGKAATRDLQEIEDANLDLSDTQLVVYAGGSKAWHTPNLSSTNNSFLELTPEGFEVVVKDDLRNMAESDTLAYFLDHVYQNYKATEYDLILWNHGGGPIYGYGQDELHPSDLLDLNEFAQALKDSPFNSNNKLELIGFDACLMASVEVADIARDYAEYMVGSQETEPGQGWNYDYLGAVNKNLNVQEMGQQIIDDYYSYFAASDEQITLSLLDLSKMDQIEKTINTIFSNLEEDIDKGDFANLARMRFNTKEFGRFTTGAELDLVDLLDMAEQLTVTKSSSINQLEKQLEQAIIYQKSNIDRANGLSMYYPYTADQKQIEASLMVYDKIGFAKSYRSYLTKFVANLFAETSTNWDVARSIPISSPSNKSDFTFQLTSEQNNDYAQATYIVFRDMKDGYFMPMFKSSEVTKDENGLLHASVQKRSLTILDKNNEQAWLSMMEAERSADYTNYLVPIIVQNLYAPNGDMLELNEDNYKSFYLQVRIDAKHPQGQMLGLVPLSEESFMAPKELSKLSDWQYVQFINNKYKITDLKGEYTDDWQSSGITYVDEMKVADLKPLTFATIDNDEYDYYCLFTIQDLRGNSYRSSIVKMQK